MIFYVQCDENNQVLHVATSPIGANPIEIEVDSEDVFDNPSAYKYENGNLIKDDSYFLKLTKQRKDIELNQACNEAILSGFNHTIDGVEYHFSYDYDAQGNFRDAKEVLKDGIVPSINWTVQKDGKYMRIPINLATLQALQVTILEHKDSNISKYRDTLLPMVYAAETIEEVNSVNWDSV